MVGTRLVSSLLVCLACAPAVRAADVPPGSAGDPIDASATALPPLWQEGPASLHRHRAAASASLSPFVTSALPEDAAWEGFVTPASNGNNALTIEYQGKLVIGNSGAAGSVRSPFLALWDGTRFEPLPAFAGAPTALGLWNGQLVVAALGSNPAAFSILRLSGAAWDTLGVANSFVWALGEWQGRLVAGGRFATVNGVSAPLVAAFDGSSWSAAGSGMSGFEVKNFAVHGTALVAAGTMAPLKSVASLSAPGATWQIVGAGFTGSTGDVVSDGIYLYACGALASSAGVTMGGLARWNGTNWTSLIATGASSDARMRLFNGKVVATIRASSGPGAVGKLGQWDGVSYASILGDSIGFSLGGGIGHLATWGTKLVATGNFITNGSVLVPSLVTFDGTQWGTISEPWSPGMTGPTMWPVNDLRSWGGKLIASGQFSLIADQDHWLSHVSISAWDGAHWSPLASGLLGHYVWLTGYQGDLVAFGENMSVRGTSVTSVARWNGSAWSGFGTGAPDYCEAGQEFHGDLYLASYFGTSALFRWNGTAWSSIPALDGSYLYALGVTADSLVVGGEAFAVSGSSNVAFWDGTSLLPAGAGLNAPVLTIANWNGRVVVGGSFTASGATSLSGVAIWDGTQWQPMGTRAAEVDQLRVIDGELFATGDFTMPDNSVALTIAHWTGTDWHVLGSAGGGYPLEGFGGYLYQAGSGLVHGHLSHGLSRVPLSAVLDVPRAGPHASPLALTASPNPSRGRTAFAFTLPSAGHARLTVVDLAGRIVATLADGAFDAGEHQARWSAAAPAGVYFARLEAPGGVLRVTRVVRFE